MSPRAGRLPGRRHVPQAARARRLSARTGTMSSCCSRASASASGEIAATRSRLAKRAVIAAAIGEAAADEIALVVTYLSGTLRQRRTGLGWASMGDLPPPAVESTLTLREVDDAFEAISALGGTGSSAARTAAVAALFSLATEPEQYFLRGLVFDELRQGALDSLVQDGLAAAYEVPVAAVQRASMLLGSTPAAAELLAGGGLDALRAVGLTVGIPVRPMLAASAPDAPGAVESRACRPRWTPSSTASAYRCTGVVATSAPTHAVSTTSPSGCRRSSRPSRRCRPGT